MAEPHDPEHAVLAARLREARETLGLTQTDVADKIGMCRTGLVDLEWGRRNVTGLELRRFSRLYRVPVTWLLGEEDDPPLNAALVAAIAHLSETDQDAVVRFARFLAQQDAKAGQS